MIAFVDGSADFERHHGHHLIAFDSGGEKIKLLLTRHALLLLIAAGAREAREATQEPPFEGILPFKRSKSK